MFVVHVELRDDAFVNLNLNILSNSHKLKSYFLLKNTITLSTLLQCSFFIYIPSDLFPPQQ